MNDWEAYSRFRKEFAQALDPDRYTIEWLDTQVQFGAIMVMGDEEACILFEWKHYPTGAMDVHGMMAAGDMSVIVEKLIPEALEYGKGMGCIGGLISSREGWGRVLKKTGWEIHQTTLRKAL